MEIADYPWASLRRPRKMDRLFQEFEHVVSECKLCGGDNISLHDARFSLVPVRPTLRCIDCGAVTKNPEYQANG